MTRSKLPEHVATLVEALLQSDEQWRQAEIWGRELAERLSDGARLLLAGNGGSAAQAQHLSAELVGRYCRDRRPFSAVALHTDTSALTAIVNDYGPEELFARQVEAHAGQGTMLLLLSTSGRSANLVSAAERATLCGVEVWAMTGPRPNPLAEIADSAICFPAPTTAAVQELHLTAIHLVCEVMDDVLLADSPTVAVG